MLSSIDLKSGEPNWANFQNTAIDEAFRLQDFLGGDERSAAFTARPLGDPGTNVVIRLYPAKDDSAAEKQIGLWLRAKELEHPNLVRILGAGRVSAANDLLIYVALEPADEKLASVLAERRLEPDEAAEILKSVTNALGHLHAKAYVHGGVSPEQIFAIGDAIKLSTENIHSAGSHEELFADAPKFLAPESQGVNATTAADVWCLGATLYECLTQESPDGTEFHHTTLPEPHRTIVRRALDPDAQARCTLEEITDLQSAKRAAAAAAVAPTVAPAPAVAPVVPEVAPKPVAVPAVIRPAEGSYRPPVLGARYDANPKREGVPVWAYGAGVLIILLGLILLLRPKSTERKAAPPPASTPTLPSAQQKEIPPSSEAAAKSRGGRDSGPAASRSRTKPSPQVRSRQAAAPGAAVPSGAVWRVIVYTYNTRDDAQRRVETINQKHPNLKAEVFSLAGDAAPFMVVVGGSMSRDQAKSFRQIAVNSGMPRDAYLQNFTH
jgi:eukaryotic-like serine/threonine-protein kinase